MAAADQIREKMHRMNDIIMESEISVRDGKMVNLAGMDQEVAVICKQCTALKPEDAMDIQPLMAEMIGNLERLGSALKDYKDSVQKKK